MSDKKLRVFIDSNKITDEVFKFRQKHVDDLLRKDPGLASVAEFVISEYENDKIGQWPGEEFERFYRDAADADVLVGFRFPTEELARRAGKLRWIHYISSGVEHMAPFDWLPEGVKVVNNRGVHSRKSRESFAMFLRMLSARVPRMLTAQRGAVWDRVFTSAVRGKTLVVFGVGCQGGEMARAGRSMGLKVTGVDPYRKECEYCDEMVPLEGVKDAFAKADFLAITAPATPETEKTIDAEKLGWLPETAGVINVSRGAVLDESALCAKLKDGSLSGAVLDVFDTEPLPPDSPLWQTPNLLIMPHVSSDDLTGYIPLTLELVAENIRNDLAGRPLKNAVDVGRGF
jgi:phosphoglycerate dehydrogenase-like enzyme